MTRQWFGGAAFVRFHTNSLIMAATLPRYKHVVAKFVSQNSKPAGSFHLMFAVPSHDLYLAIVFVNVLVIN